MTIKVTIKNIYGNETIYPACEKAVLFAHLVGQKTLTRHDILIIKQIGYKIEIVQAQVEL